MKRMLAVVVWYDCRMSGGMTDIPVHESVTAIASQSLWIR